MYAQLYKVLFSKSGAPTAISMSISLVLNSGVKGLFIKERRRDSRGAF